MSTIAVSQKGYVGNEEKKVSLKEKMKKYFEENGAEYILPSVIDFLEE